jgi:hypothetical protein
MKGRTCCHCSSVSRCLIMTTSCRMIFIGSFNGFQTVPSSPVTLMRAAGAADRSFQPQWEHFVRKARESARSLELPCDFGEAEPRRLPVAILGEPYDFCRHLVRRQDKWYLCVEFRKLPTEKYNQSAAPSTLTCIFIDPLGNIFLRPDLNYGIGWDDSDRIWDHFLEQPSSLVASRFGSV